MSALFSVADRQPPRTGSSFYEMRTYTLLVGLLWAWGFGAAPALAQQISTRRALPEASFPIAVSTDQGDKEGLILGIDPAATTGIDQAFQEKERPPLPPSSVFDARLIGESTPATGRLGQGVTVDIRPGSTRFAGQKTHRIQVQPGTADSLTFTWTFPDGVTGTIEDALGGAVFGPVLMRGRDSITIGAGAPDALVTVDYSGNQKQVNVQSVQIRRDTSVAFLNTGVAVGFAGVSSPATVTVRRVGNGPSSTVGIAETNVSSYRHVIEPESAFKFKSAEVRMAVWTLQGIENPSAVTLYKRSQEGRGQFSALATNVTSGGTPGDVSDDTLYATTQSFSEFALGSDTESLPVELTDFEATVDGDAVRLSWTTASETKNVGFGIQRTAGTEENASWSRVGFVKSKAPGGSTPEPRSYRFTDGDLPYEAETVRYRLKQVDTDGTAGYSDPLTVERKVTTVELLGPYPNPVRERATLRYALPERQPVSIRLYDVLGRRVGTLASEEKPAGRYQVHLDVGTLPSGTYFVRMRGGSFAEMRRLVVTR